MPPFTKLFLLTGLLFASFKVSAQVPVISSISPLSGPVGTSVVITGNNFGAYGTNTIYFGAVKATVTASTGTSITVTAPPGASCQPVTVTANGLTGYAPLPYIVTFDDARFSAASFTPKFDMPSGAGVYGVAVKDLDGDGKPDIVAANSNSQNVSFFKNASQPGKAVFIQVFVKPLSGNCVGVASDDLDGDGKPDVAVTNLTGGTLSLFKNRSTNGLLNFDDAITLRTGPDPYDVVIADFNGDGKPDLAITYNNSFPAAAAVFINQTTRGGALTFSAAINLATQDFPRGISAADIDGDGMQDIVVSCQNRSLSVFRNTSAAGLTSFAAGMTINMPAGSSPESTVITDLDGDRKPDITIANNNAPGTITVLKNNSSRGGIAFLPLQEFPTGANPFSIAASDIDGDGKPDIAVTDQVTNAATVLINKSARGQISLSPGINFQTDQQPRSIFAGDIDGDGKPDLVAGNIEGNDLSLLLAATAPIIQAGPVSGKISACTGSPSSSPELEQFTVSGTNLAGDVTAVAPAGFQLSLTPLTGFSGSVPVPTTGGTIYVRSSSSAAGAISGNILLSSPGAVSVQIGVSGMVYSPPSVVDVPPQTVSSGNKTTAINFTGQANGFTWVNDTPGIGLAVSGNGNIPSFTAINNGTVPVIATITVTPLKQGYAIISNSGSNNVSMINTLTHAVDATIPVGLEPWGIAVSPDGRFAYIANASQTATVENNKGSISVIDVAEKKVAATIPVGKTPYALVISPDGSKIYVTNINDGQVMVINTATNAVDHIINVSSVFGLAISPDGKWLYVSGNEQQNHLYKISTATNMISGSTALPSSSAGLVVSKDGVHIYLAGGNTGKVLVLNATTLATEATISVGGTPYGITMLPDGSRVYVSNWSANQVSVINTANNTLLAPVTLTSYSYGIAASPDGSELYIAGQNPDIISVINVSTQQVNHTVLAGSGPMSLGNFVIPGSPCSGMPITFKITVDPVAYPEIRVAGNMTALTTIYGTASGATAFQVSSTALTAGIQAAAPAGFELSSDGLSFSKIINLATTGTLYVRLSATTPAGTYSGNMLLSSPGASDVTVSLTASVVMPAALRVTANNITKTYGATLQDGTFSDGFGLSGLQNGETANTAVLNYGAAAAALFPVGTYSAVILVSSLSGGSFDPHNYTINYLPGDISVLPAPLVVTADNKTKKTGTANPLLTVTYAGFISPDDSTSLSVLPRVTTTANQASSPGEYPILAGGAIAKNYQFTYKDGILTVIPDPALALVIPSAFTPNGDGINDQWEISALTFYPKCEVSVYSRYGTLVYHSVGYSKPWDGTFQGGALPSGTYYYIVNLHNGEKPASRYVALIR